MQKMHTFPALLAMVLCGLGFNAHAQLVRNVTPTPAATTPAPAATSAPSQAEAAPAPATPALNQATRQITIGSATERLLHAQRVLPPQRSRHIDGEQASRSYQRYLQSFETKIPEQFETGVDVKN